VLSPTSSIQAWDKETGSLLPTIILPERKRRKKRRGRCRKKKKKKKEEDAYRGAHPPLFYLYPYPGEGARGGGKSQRANLFTHSILPKEKKERVATVRSLETLLRKKSCKTASTVSPLESVRRAEREKREKEKESEGVIRHESHPFLLGRHGEGKKKFDDAEPALVLAAKQYAREKEKGKERVRK